MDIAEINTRNLAELIKIIDDKDVHNVAGRMRQYLTKIMRHAVQQSIIKYNTALDLGGVVRPIVAQHLTALPLRPRLIHVRHPSQITTDAPCRIGELYAVEAGIRGRPAEVGQQVRKTRSRPLRIDPRELGQGKNHHVIALGRYG